MNMKIKRFCIGSLTSKTTLIAFCASALVANGHEVPVHERITVYAEASAEKYSASYLAFLNAIVGFRILLWGPPIGLIG